MSATLVLEPHRATLWWLCYRMTGVAADADELVQETFLRALESPPHERSDEILPWLRRIAVNASTDLLRRRKVRGYSGEWLPSPVELESLPDETLSASARYGQRESLSYAFLVALEALTPEQRAVLVLRDVLDYSVREAADALSLSEPNVKTTHHRARAALAKYDVERRPPNPAREAVARAAMLRLFAFVAMGDASAVERLLSQSILAVQDSNGEFHAAFRPMRSPQHVAKFFVGVSRKSSFIGAQAGMFNGLPGMLTLAKPYVPRAPAVTISLFDADDQGLIIGAYAVVASNKLNHLGFAQRAFNRRA